MAIDPVTVFVAGFVFVVLAQALVFGYAFAKYANLFARIEMITQPLGVDRWAGLAALSVFLAGFAWLTIAGDVPDEGESMRIPVFLAIVAFGVGLFCVALAVSNLGRYRRTGRRTDARSAAERRAVSRLGGQSPRALRHLPSIRPAADPLRFRRDDLRRSVGDRTGPD